MFLIFFFLGTSSETRMGDSNKATTSTVDIAQPEPNTTLTNTEGLITSVVSTGDESSPPEGFQVAGETAAVVAEETSSSIDDMTEEMSQAMGLEVPMIEAGEVSISAEDMAKGPSQF